MSWSTATDVRVFLAAAGEFLATDPVGHTMLLTEAAYLEATSAEGEFGWWTDAFGAVAGAFLRAPRHPPVLTPVPEEALASLVDVLGGVSCLGVDGRDVERVASAWREGAGVALVERFRVALCRLTSPPVEASEPGRSRSAGASEPGRSRSAGASEPGHSLRAGASEPGRSHPVGAIVPGRSRRATAADRELLAGWFHDLMAANPEDPSDLAYVVDEPLRYGGLTLWEVDGRPVAMAGRSRVVAGMTRVSASYAPDGRTDAVFAAACAEAAEVAKHVLVLTNDVAAHREQGFEVVLDRVTLEAAH